MGLAGWGFSCVKFGLSFTCREDGWLCAFIYLFIVRSSLIASSVCVNAYRVQYLSFIFYFLVPFICPRNRDCNKMYLIKKSRNEIKNQFIHQSIK